MIQPDTSHPQYDLAMEALCCLSTTPTALLPLRRDLVLNTVAELCVVLRRLKERGLRVTLGQRIDAGRYVVPYHRPSWAQIQPEDWPAVEQACEAYWDAVYANALPAAA